MKRSARRVIAMGSYPQKLLQPIYVYLKRRWLELKRKRETVEQADPYQSRMLTEGLASPDRKVAELTEHDTLQALGENLDQDLRLIEEAMQKIKDGSYGFCNHCQGMINTDRLAIYPEAIYCIKCEQEMESGSVSRA